MALTDNLISVWHMNNAWTDSIGSNHGTATGAIFSTSSKLGSHAGSFDGTDDYVTIANEGNFDFEINNAFSIAAWVKTSDTVGDESLIAKRLDGAGFLCFAYLPTGTAKKFLFQLHQSNTPNPNIYKYKYGGTTINDNNWHLVVATYDGSNTLAGMKLYVDGSLETTTDAELGTITTMLNNTALVIGRREYYNSHYFNGLMDEGAVWSRAITAAEITELWNGGAGMEIGAGVVIPVFMNQYRQRRN